MNLMAGNFITIDEPFDKIKNQIENIFNGLIHRLEKKKKYLLEIVKALQDEYEYHKATTLRRIEDLERAQETQEQISLRENENIAIRGEIAQVFKNKISILEASIPCKNLTFDYSLLSELQSMIERFGEVLKCESIDFSSKQTAIVTTGKAGKLQGEFDNARGVAVNEIKNQIFVADRDNSRIQVFTFEGEFVSEFGKSNLKNPYGITVTTEHVFVTDTFHHSVFKYTSSPPFELVSRAGGKGSSDGQLNRPHGLSVDTCEDVYIAEYWNYRVSIFTKNLNFIRSIGKGILAYPKDVKLTRSAVVVLDCSAQCIHFFSRDGILLTSCVTQGYQQHCVVHDPYFFCIDESGNIILSDRQNHLIKILSHSGELIQTLGEKGKGKGQLIHPKGVCVSKSGIIFVTSVNPKYALQSF